MIKLKPTFNILLIFTIAISLGANYRIYESSPPVYVGHLVVFLFGVLVAFSCVTLAATRIKPPSAQIPGLLVVLFVISYASLGYLYGSPRFFLEFAKIAFTLFTFYTLSLAYANLAIDPRSVPIGIVIGVLLSTVTVVNLPDLAATGVTARLDAEMLGNFNAYSFIVANAMLSLLFFLDTAKSTIAKGALLVCFGYLGIFLLASFSRNGMLSLIVGVLILMSTSARAKSVFLAIPAFLLMFGAVIYLFFGDFAPFIGRYIVADDLTSGSGRIEIWNLLLAELFNSPRALLFGYGMGGIDTEVEGGVHGVFSAHNAFLQLWHEFGSIAFLGIVYGVVKLWRGIRWIRNMKERAFLYAIFGQLVTGLFFDSHHQSSQLGWTFALWVITIIAATRIGGMRASCKSSPSVCNAVG